jgi:hypothetical protein
MHHHTASKLLRECDHAQIERMCEFVAYRLEHGWVPQESVGAWLVAAIRNRYETPPYFRSRREQDEEKERQERGQALDRERAEREKRRAEADLQRQREGKLLSMGVEQNVDKLWKEVQQRLRERGEWSVCLSLCFLKDIEDRLALLLVPSSVRTRVLARAEDIAKTLSEVVSGKVELVVREIGG